MTYVCIYIKDMIYIYIYIYIYNGLLLSHKRKNEILPFVTAWTDQQGIMLSEISQTEKDK